MEVTKNNLNIVEELKERINSLISFLDDAHAKLNFNGNPWENKSFQSEYSDLTWRELYDYVKYFTEIYSEVGYEEGEKVLDSINNRFDQMRDDLITWKETKD